MQGGAESEESGPEHTAAAEQQQTGQVAVPVYEDARVQHHHRVRPRVDGVEHVVLLGAHAETCQQRETHSEEERLFCDCSEEYPI